MVKVKAEARAKRITSNSDRQSKVLKEMLEYFKISHVKSDMAAVITREDLVEFLTPESGIM